MGFNPGAGAAALGLVLFLLVTLGTVGLGIVLSVIALVSGRGLLGVKICAIAVNILALLGSFLLMPSISYIPVIALITASIAMLRVRQVGKTETDIT